MNWLSFLVLILRAYPSEWPLPVPLSSDLSTKGVRQSVEAWVKFDKVADSKFNSELITLNPACRGKRFNYIVVGAGAAGMVVATRLASKSRHARVLLLEAGGKPSIFNEIPADNFLMVNQPSNTWRYRLTPQKRCCQISKDKRPVTTRGKMMGGSTSLNLMMYVRGHRQDFDGWARMLDDEGWNFWNTLPYFKKSEDYNGVYANDPESYMYHGRGGLLNVATYDYMPGADELMAAGIEKGYKVGDYNGADNYGEVFSKLDMTTQNGWRESTYRAFYRDASKPKNLCIKKYAHVHKINFKVLGYGIPRAAGVTYVRHGMRKTVEASEEVILCAGALESPKLLMLSGVGPPSELSKHGIRIVQSSPVGKYMQDHLGVFVGPFLKAPSFNPNRDMRPSDAADFLEHGSGVIAAPSGLTGTAFFQSPVARPAYPDLQIYHFSVSLFPEFPEMFSGVLGFSADKLSDWFYPYHKQNTDARFMIMVLGRPKSTGEITLASTNPYDNPIIDPNYLHHPEDEEALVYGFKTVVDLYENTTALNTPLFGKPAPGCENLEFKSDEYYSCAVRHLSTSFYHHVGTCSMGKVVDSRLRVMGVDRLRVIDASVIPKLPNANTQAAAIMIGEKGADMIIEDNPGFWGWG